MPTRVIKVGGSLLDWPLLPAALRRWLDEQPPGLNVLLCGGGELADIIRRADRDFQLGETFSHWLCIDVMSITARLLAAVLADAPLVTDHDELLARVAHGEAGDVVFDVARCLRDRESTLPGVPLPHDWSVTSDSIAARLAEVLGADELVLLKSSDPPADCVADLIAARYIDRHFAAYAKLATKLRIVNLRGSLGRDSGK
jgi:5-(aminomethyl)-3-furanmethanol phosphate kinase